MLDFDVVGWWDAWMTRKRANRIKEAEKQKKRERMCLFCREYDGTEESTISDVWENSVYESFRPTYKYHRKCIEDVLDNPEKHGHGKVDVALRITEAIKYWKNNIGEAKRFLNELPR